MAINATSTSQTPRELIPAGNYIARCYKMIEIGTVPTEYLGVEKMTHKVRFGWELPLELKVFNPEKGEQPLVIDKEYTLSLADKANLRRDLKSWRGKDFTPQEAEMFDVTKLLGVPCMLNIIHVAGKKDPTKFYEAVSSISPMPKGIVCPPQINETFVFDFENFDKAKFDTLPQFIREMIVTSNEYKLLHGLEPQEIPLKSAVDAYQSKKEEPEDDELLF
jgi:hypothetical protein